MIQQKHQRIVSLIDKIYLFLLGIICVLYSVYHSHFAELRIKPGFLNFPVFIGEIVLFLCAVWWVIRWGLKGFPRTRAGGILAGYVIWLVLKAAKGYIDYGPLAFRNAALFYYPLFAVFVYSLAGSLSVRDRRWWMVLLLGIVLILSHGMYRYFYLPYFLLAVLCIIKLGNKRYQIIGLLALFIVFPLREFFVGGRAALLGTLTAFTSLLITGIIVVPSSGRKRKWPVLVAGIGILVAGFFFYPASYKVRTLIDWDPWLKDYSRLDRVVQKNKTGHIMREFEPQLYHDNQDVARSGGVRKKDVGPRFKGVKKKDVDPALLEDIAYGNIIFRLLIWRDMLADYGRGNFLAGLSFGKPLRSISIEILNWAPQVWRRDGWLMPHNAFLHMIYRGGLVGAMMILGIFSGWSFLLIRFVRFRSLVGLLLCAILIYWLVVAAFSVTLELPYQAIPFWSLGGLAVYYNRRLARVHAKIKKTAGAKGQDGT